VTRDQAARPPAERAGPDSSTSARRGNTIIAPAGLEQSIANAARDWWYQGGLVAIRQLVRTRRVFTIDQLSDMIGEPPDPHYWGALFAGAQKLRIIEPVGARVGRDGRLVRLWWGLPT
jgi:hypothetical protein